MPRQPFKVEAKRNGWVFSSGGAQNLLKISIVINLIVDLKIDTKGHTLATYL